MEYYMGEEGVDLRIDDTAGATGILRAIRRASNKVLEYVQGRYSVAELNGNDWVTDITTIIACHYLSRRRGNPGLFEDEYNEAIASLERVRTENAHIPGAGTLSDHLPGFSNLTVDDRFHLGKLRVQRGISSNDAYLDENTSRDPLEFDEV